eukprot:COSAG02_NODE_2677_length_8267_cov_29.491797_3_plen_225_part_00
MTGVLNPFYRDYGARPRPPPISSQRHAQPEKRIASQRCQRSASAVQQLTSSRRLVERTGRTDRRGVPNLARALCLSLRSSSCQSPDSHRALPVPPSAPLAARSIGRPSHHRQPGPAPPAPPYLIITTTIRRAANTCPHRSDLPVPALLPRPPLPSQCARTTTPSQQHSWANPGRPPSPLNTTGWPYWAPFRSVGFPINPRFGINCKFDQNNCGINEYHLSHRGF